MTEASAITLQFFQPWHYIFYLAIIFMIMVVYYQFRWAKTCSNNIQVLVAQRGGGGEFILSPKVGGEVSIKNPHTDTIRTWPVNELATIDVSYPGVGFVPKFMQKTIRLAIVNEGDWEPMLNRSPHMKNVASPDVAVLLADLKEHTEDPVLKDRLETTLKNISTGPTREMIASPAVLGNLIYEKITEAVIAVNKEVLDQFAGLTKKLDKMVSPTVFYIGIGLVLAGIVAIIFIMQQGDVSSIANDVQSIKQALGVQ